MKTIKVKVKYFSILRELLKKEEEIIELSKKSTIKDLLNILYINYPQLEEYYFLVSKNHQYTKKRSKIKDNDEVALIPPVSGG